jgi:hypothetical protein
MANQENIRKWVEALRSGEYEQGTGRLKTRDGSYCCLGVACDISGLVTESSRVPYLIHEDRRPFPTFEFTDASGDTQREEYGLPVVVAEWLGLEDSDVPLAEREAEWDGDDDTTIYAASANDDLGWSFEQIADAIEERYLTAA